MVSDCYPKIQIGQYAPEFIGWQPIHGTEEHEHSPSPVVSFTKRGTIARFATLLIPQSADTALDCSIRLNDGGFAITVNGKALEFENNDPRFTAIRNLDESSKL
jgi:hypothetical protein